MQEMASVILGDCIEWQNWRVLLLFLVAKKVYKSAFFSKADF